MLPVSSNYFLYKTLLFRTFILTAGHCIFNEKSKGKEHRIYLDLKLGENYLHLTGSNY